MNCHCVGQLRGDPSSKPEKAVGGSFYGRNVWVGLNSAIDRAGVMGKLKVLSLAIFGTYFAAFTSYYSFDGSVRIIKWSIEERMLGEPLPSDIGHGGEWMQQPFQNLLVYQLCLLSPLANEGHLCNVKSVYKKLIKKAFEQEEADFSGLFFQFEEDFKYLAKRSFCSTDLFAIKRELVHLFDRIDLSLFDCPSLEIDRALLGDYADLEKKIAKLNNWNPVNLLKNWKIAAYQMGKRGVGQAVEKGVYFSLFQFAMLLSSAILLFGLTIVIDEVFLSKSGEEASGHLSEWTVNIVTNLLLIYFSYLFLIKREAMLTRTGQVFENHLLQQDRENPFLQERLVETMNSHLDHLAEKCHFTHLPSSYRIRTAPDETPGPSRDSG